MDGLRIRDLHSVEEMRGCEAIEKVVWQVDDREVVPASLLKAVAHAGGMVTGAFVRERMVGYLFAFPARCEGEGTSTLHSHLMGVMPEFRKHGVGRALKRYQREWCLARGFAVVTWTFDPLMASNARLNLEQLGAIGIHFEPDLYGSLGGVVYGSLATDRLLLRWSLRDPVVAALAAGEGRPRDAGPHGDPPPGPEAVTTVLEVGSDGDPGPVDSEQAGPWLRLPVPERFPPLLYEAPERARAWREAVGTALAAYVARGYQAVRFVDGAYLLHRPPEPQVEKRTLSK